MGGTALKRKARRNKAKAKFRLAKIKLQGFKPVIRNVDIDAVKEEFSKTPKAKSSPKVEEPKDEKVIEAVKAETKVAPKKETKATAPAKEEVLVKGSSEEKKDAPKVKKKAAPKTAVKSKPTAVKKQTEKT